MSDADERERRDRRHMAMALALGRRHLGLTAPNPSVGAIVVREEAGRAVIVAQGVTQPGGRPHAERVALAAAGGAARGATLYVSLEPCSHHGRTPPCARAIVAAGIARVVSAAEDADPRVAGRGHAMLRAAGIAVETGLMAAEAARDHLGHVLRVREGRPMLTLKLARTADGYAAETGPERLMVTGEGANARTHLRRAHADAILIGVGTALADDPALDVRLPGLEDRSPTRIVLDSRLRLPDGARLVATARTQPTWLIACEAADRREEARLRNAGVDVLRITAAPNGRVDLRAAMAALAARGLTRVFCEGGPILADALAAEDLVDEIVLLTGRRRLDAPGVAALGPHLTAAIANAFRPTGRETVGHDLIETFERKQACSPGS